jgi:outer membrane protein insertion porin family
LPRPRPSGVRGIVTVCLVLAAAGGFEVRPAGAQVDLLGEVRTVAEIRFEGREHVGEGELRSVIKTRGPSFWPWSERPALRSDFLRSDTLAIRLRYIHHGFLDNHVGVLVTPHRDSSQVTVTFLVEEGLRTRVHVVEFTGDLVLKEDELRRKLRTRVGEAFDPAVLQLDTLKISEIYQERGFRPHVVASAWRDSTDSLRMVVRFDIAPGSPYRVGEVLVSGNDRVAERLVRRELLLNPGELYKRSRMVRSGERLYDTDLFSQVQISPIVDSTHSNINFDLRVRPRKPRWIDAGIGSGTTERFRATGEWGHRNMFGRGFQGVLGTEIGFDQKGRFVLSHTQVSLLEPWLLRTRTRASLTPSYERTNDFAIDSVEVRQETRGIKVEFGRDISRSSSVTLTFNNLHVHQQNRPTTAGLPIVTSTFTNNSVALGGVRDFRDSPFVPTRGDLQAITAQWAGGALKGSSSFRKVDFGSSWYTPVRGSWVLATRVRAGMIAPRRGEADLPADSLGAIVPINDRFRSGGVNSVRGYQENTIAATGGLAILQANIELRVPVWRAFGFETYVDVGNVWARTSYVKWSDFTPTWSQDPIGDNQVRYVIGVGPRLNLPIGPLRFDVSWGFQPIPPDDRRRAKFQFAIGPSY